MKHTVSVIVPNYRHARYLAQRLDSIYSQTVPPHEVIILDDCSPDNSLTVIDRYLGRPNTRLIANNTNSGDPFSQWNKGINLCTGHFVWIAESDDWAEADFLAELLSLADRWPNAGLLYCQSEMVDDNGDHLFSLREHYRGLPDEERWDREHGGPGNTEVSRYLSRRNIIPNASACLFRRDVLQEIGGASTGFRLCGDWLTYARVLHTSGVAYTPQILNHYRRHAETARHSAEKALAESLESYRVLAELDRLQPLNESERAIAGATVFQRFRHLVRSSSVNHFDRWKDLSAAAAQFDSHFARRLDQPERGGVQQAIVYHAQPGAPFTEDKRVSVEYAAWVWQTLVFPSVGACCRFDPCTCAGRIQLQSVVASDRHGDERWRADASTGFAGLTIQGTALACGTSGSDLILWAWSDDPIVLLAPLELDEPVTLTIKMRLNSD